MFPETVIFLLLAAVIGSSSLTGLLVWLYARTRRLEGQDPGGQQGVASQLETLHEELEAVHRAVVRVEEHANFTQQLLEGRAAGGSLPGGSGPQDAARNRSE
jgi:hypothetical protein